MPWIELEHYYPQQCQTTHHGHHAITETSFMFNANLYYPLLMSPCLYNIQHVFAVKPLANLGNVFACPCC